MRTDTAVWALVWSAFESGAKWALAEVSMANDGDGHVDRIDPLDDEIKSTAKNYARRALGVKGD